MAKSAKSKEQSLDFAFFNFLKWYYDSHKKEIRKAYTIETKKFLDYNDKSVNRNAWLRTPQFEALEMYVFVKEFLDNRTMQEIFKLWKNKESVFSDRFTRDTKGQLTTYDILMPQYDAFEKYLEDFRKDYPNYIYALTMGLGKTVLMATCIFYEFINAYKHKNDVRFCHNALVFAPDKTVLESLREITTMDKSKVMPEEFLNILDSHITFFFLDDTDSALTTLDGSEYNIIISNTQKLILKRRNRALTPVEQLFAQTNATSGLGGMLEEMKQTLIEEDLISEENYLENQRFEKLKRLDKLGIYVDEAHHMFGNDLKKQIINHETSSLRNTIDILSREYAKQERRIIACYNYTGTPYIENMVLPEVVYSFALKPAIDNHYLKDVYITAEEKVKEKQFLRDSIDDFFKKYKGKTFEDLLPKLAIFASEIKEINQIKPIVEEKLSELGIDSNTILVNVGDEKYTKDEEIRDFNNLDVVGSVGSKKQVIILVGKGKEGWNCRSLFGVALFREPKSKIFVLQASMRCLRAITDEQQTASIYLSKDNLDILDEELKNNFKTSVKEIQEKKKKDTKLYNVKVNLPERKIKIKKIEISYTITKKQYSSPIDFELDSIDLENYKAKKYTKKGLTSEICLKEETIDTKDDNMKYSLLTLVGEIRRYFKDETCKDIERILVESKDGIEKILEKCSTYNQIVNDVIVNKIFSSLYDVERIRNEKEEEVILLKAPINNQCYEYVGQPNLVIEQDSDIKEVKDNKGKSFHADTYIFDSKPERELFLQALDDVDVAECYFTGMFTNEKTGFAVPYIDPETNTLRNYYPDFIIKLSDGSYIIIEVKADFKVGDPVVIAKANATKEIMTDKGMDYMLVESSRVEKERIKFALT